MATGAWARAAADDDAVLEALFRALERRDTLSDRERSALAEAIAEVRIYGPNDTLVRAGATAEYSTLLIS